MSREYPNREPPIRDGLWALPGFAEARKYLKRRGRPCGWIDEVVDKDEPAAQFMKAGNPNYCSECPEYEGFWLDGCIGSVQCRSVPFLIPGFHWYKTCGETPGRCPFRRAEEGSQWT